MANNWWTPRTEARLMVEKKTYIGGSSRSFSSMLDPLEPHQFTWAVFRYLERREHHHPDDMQVWLRCPPEIFATLRDGMTGLAVYKGRKLLSFQPDTPESETK